jgi:hypothetical protein
VSGFEVVSNSESYPTTVGSTTFAWATARCPAGKELIGGGAYENSNIGQMNFSGPTFIEGKIYNEQWYVGYTVPSTYASGEPLTVTSLAYCAVVN